MYKFAEKYYGYLTKNEGFYMDQYVSIIKNENIWVAVKSFSQGSYVVIVTDDKNEVIDTKEVIEYFNYKGKPYSLHKIILSDGEYINGVEDSIPKVVYDLKRNSLIRCDNSCEVLGKIAINLGKEHTRANVTNLFKEYPVTVTIILLNIIMFLISALMSKNIMDIDPMVLLRLGGKFGPLINNGEIWRFVMCNFLHGGLIHIVFNMYALYSVGTQIEYIYGRKKYILIYLVAGLGSSLLSYYVSPMSLSIGASGAIFGLLGSLLVYAITVRNSLKKGVIGNLVFVIILNLYIGMTLPNIDNSAHIGGFALGIIISFFYSIRKRNKKQRY